MLAAAVYSDGVLADFRVQLDHAPLPDDTTYDITWCLDIAGLDGDQQCGAHSDAIDAALGLSAIYPPASGQYQSSRPGVDPCAHGAYESESNTLRILVPLALVGGGSEFDWMLNVNFGGSGGFDAWVPDDGALPVTHVRELPPFSGDASCF